jgi:tRNA G10  N-methylase Trm11
MKHTSYLFIFSKPFEKTNISKGELISLIELQKRDAIIREYLVEDYEKKCGPLDLNYIDNYNFEDGITYVLFLSQSAIVICGFEINISEIIRRSGYIQSCGKLLFLSKWESISINYLKERIEQFCIKESAWYNTVFYKHSENQIQNKLDSLLIDDKRYHIKDQSFNPAVEKLQSELKIKQQELRLPFKQENIFIVLEKVKLYDHSMLSNLYEDRNVVDYGLCYLSEMKKDNPIHEMDDLKELKPYWAGIYTTPHRLMNAMLNLAKVGENSIVVDPFCHTGTLAIEASQLGCKVIASDIVGTMGASDNYNFLCNGSKNFEKLTNEIEKHLDNAILTSSLNGIISENIELNGHGLPITIEEVPDSVAKMKLSERLYFYILRRYGMETLRGADIDAQDYKSFVKDYIYKSSGSKDLPSYRLYMQQFACFENAYIDKGIPLVEINSSNENIFIDSYYKSSRMGYINIKPDHIPSFMKNDICGEDNYNIKESSVDAVVTDPPYGYGEDLSKDKIRSIYQALVEKSIKWLKPQGYLVICALDKVKTGRTENLLFTEDILKIVNLTTKRNEVSYIISDIPYTSNHLRNLFYWKSKFALNRTILCLQILK